MKLFSCPTCQSVVYFDSVHCESCGTRLAYEPDADAIAKADSLCANALTVERCNWTTRGDKWCSSCSTDVDHSATALRRAFQQAKRRTFRQLNQLQVAVAGVDPQLRFALLEGTEEAPVTIGHAAGLITLDVAEAEQTRLAEIRATLGEPYRTPLGHVRHELGHWYWAADLGKRFSNDEFRSLFGDETTPYDEALSEHYAEGNDGSWTASHISHYASAHPWEDFAETFAHVLHMLDTMETAAAHGVNGGQHPIDLADFDGFYEQWIDLSRTLNDLNRSMGTPDPYPFVAPAPAVEKLRFVADTLIHS